MPRVCKKDVRIGKELFEGEIFLLPDGRFLYIFPDWMEELQTDLNQYGFEWGYNPKRGKYKASGLVMAETQKVLEDKIEAIVDAANKMAAKESLVIFYKFDFEIRNTSENNTLRNSDFGLTSYGDQFKTGLFVEWQIVRQFKYSETNIIYKHQKYGNTVEMPYGGDKIRIIDHTLELEEFFKAFDVGLEAMIEKLLAINDAEALPKLIEKMGPEQLMAPEQPKPRTKIYEPGHYW